MTQLTFFLEVMNNLKRNIKHKAQLDLDKSGSDKLKVRFVLHFIEFSWVSV